MYGTQTHHNRHQQHSQFENDVKMYGTQTIPVRSDSSALFDNDVKCMVVKNGRNF